MGRIVLRLDRVMADRKMSLKELSEKVGVSNVNLSKMKTGKISAIRFSTLEAICEVLDCQPGDIMETFKAIEITEKDGTKRTVKLKTSNADEDIRQYYLEEMQREREISYSRVRKEMEKNENS